MICILASNTYMLSTLNDNDTSWGLVPTESWGRLKRYPGDNGGGRFTNGCSTSCRSCPSIWALIWSGRSSTIPWYRRLLISLHMISIWNSCGGRIAGRARDVWEPSNRIRLKLDYVSCVAQFLDKHDRFCQRFLLPTWKIEGLLKSGNTGDQGYPGSGSCFCLCIPDTLRMNSTD